MNMNSCFSCYGSDKRAHHIKTVGLVASQVIYCSVYSAKLVTV